jgi:hypothetical protein
MISLVNLISVNCISEVFSIFMEGRVIKRKISLGSLIIVLFLTLFCSNLMADLNDGLIAYYPLDGDTSDSSGNHNYATGQGGISFVEGVSGQALSLDGIDDLVSISSSESLRTSFLTISFWLKTQQENLTVPFSALYSTGPSNNSGYELILNNPNFPDRIRVDVMTAPTGNWGANSLTSLNDNEWKHILSTFDGRYSKIYVNGVLEGTFDCTDYSHDYWEGPIRWTSPYHDFIIGYTANTNRESTTSMFNGLIDEIKIYNRVLDTNEIYSLYQIDSNIITIPNVDFEIPESKNTEYSRLQFVTRGYIKNTVHDADIVDISTADNSIDPIGLNLIDTTKPIYLVVHGWRPKEYFECTYTECGDPDENTPLREYMRNLVGKIKENIDANILVWNWEYEAVGLETPVDKSFPPPFYKIDAQAKKLNSVLGQVLDAISYDNDIYIIGHSLGAGVAMKMVDLESDFADNYLTNIKRISLFDPPDKPSLELPKLLMPLFGPFIDMTLNIQDEISSVKDRLGDNIFIDNYIASNGEFFKNFGIKYDDVTNVYLNDMNHTKVVSTWLVGTADPDWLSDLKGRNDASTVGINWDSTDYNLYDLKILENLSERSTTVVDLTNTWELEEKTGTITTVGNHFLESYVSTSVKPIFIASGLGTALYKELDQILILTTGSPVAAKTDINLSEDSEYITFDFKLSTISSDTLFTVYINGSSIFERYGLSNTADLWQATPAISVKRWAGEQIELKFVIDSPDPGQLVEVKNISIYNPVVDSGLSGNILQLVMPALLNSRELKAK